MERSVRSVCTPKKPSQLGEVRAVLRRWGGAPGRMELRRNELSEISAELGAVLAPPSATPESGSRPNLPSDATVARVLRREELAGRFQSRIEELSELLRAEREFCFSVELALTKLDPREESLIRMIYRGRVPVDDVARRLLISRSQVYRLRRAAELSLAPLIGDLAA